MRGYNFCQDQQWNEKNYSEVGVFEPYPFNSPGAGIVLTPHRRALLFIDLLNNFILDSTAGILGLRDGVGVGGVDTR